MSYKKTFFEQFVSKNALPLFRKGNNPVLADLYKNAAAINLKRVAKIQAKFDPFHPNIASVREMIFFLGAPKVIKTNEECLVRTTVTTDRSEPELRFFLKNNKKLVYETGYLQTIDILHHLNNHLTELEKEFEDQ